MTKTVTLTDLVITNINIDYENQRALVAFKLVDGTGQTWQRLEAVFWVNIPPPAEGIPNPDNWFQLPASYLPTLIALRDDADTALTNKYLV